MVLGKQMNILLLSQFFSTTKGGGEYVFSILAKALADNGNKIWVITHKIDGETYQSHKNIKLVFAPTIQYEGGLPAGFSDNIKYLVFSVVKGLSIIRNEGIDLIHSNNFTPALSGSILTTLTKKPHITTVHDIFSLCGKNYWQEWRKQYNISKINSSLAPIFEKMMISLNYDAIHTVSEATKEDLIKFGAKKPIHIIPNAIEQSAISTKSLNKFQLIYIGRLVFYKNLEVVFKAIHIVRKTYPEIQLLVIGGGPHKENLKLIVDELDLHDNVKFMGYLSTEEKNELLASSNALVFPSLCEGFGLVILEAYANNKPVLVSDIRPLSDIVLNGKSGITIPPHDENEWAKAIVKLITDIDFSKKMGDAGRTLLNEQFDVKTMLKNILCMYDSVVLHV